MSIPRGFRTGGDEPTGTRLVIVRHGEAVCNVTEIAGGPTGCTGLTATGRAQAARLRDRLVLTGELHDAVALYSSTLPRAIETADICRPGLPPIDVTADCALCEMHPGQADNLTWSEIAARFGEPNWDEDPTTPIAPEGESWLIFYERTVAALRALAARHPGQRVVIFAHGGVIENAVKYALGVDPGAKLYLVTEHASMTEIEIDGDRVRLLRYNDRAVEAAS